VPIEVHHTKRAIVYRAVVPTGDAGTEKITRTFRTRAAALAWEREMLEAEDHERPAAPER
jgi:hypothetical protein